MADLGRKMLWPGHVDLNNPIPLVPLKLSLWRRLKLRVKGQPVPLVPPPGIRRGLVVRPTGDTAPFIYPQKGTIVTDFDYEALTLEDLKQGVERCRSAMFDVAQKAVGEALDECETVDDVASSDAMERAGQATTEYIMEMLRGACEISKDPKARAAMTKFLGFEAPEITMDMAMEAMRKWQGGDGADG